MQANPNPLEVLGIQPYMAALERSQNGYERLLGIAKANFRTYSRYYHPDYPGGKLAVMADLTQAIEDLDLETLPYYVDELLGGVNPGVLRRQRELSERTAREHRAYTRTVQLLAKTHQYEALRAEGPTSLLVLFGADRLVLEVVSPSQTRAALVGKKSQRASAQETPRFADGIWSEWSIHPDGFVDYTANTPLGDVRVIGGVSQSDTKGLSSGPVFVTGAVELASDIPGDREVTWHSPEQAWYMPFLRAYQPDDNIVIMQNGRVALTDAVLAQASL